MFNENGTGRHDHNSDPAHTPGDGWSDEGGASHLGPATHTNAGQPLEHIERDVDDEEPSDA